jgi:hypothetical protein
MLEKYWFGRQSWSVWLQWPCSHGGLSGLCKTREVSRHLAEILTGWPLSTKPLHNRVISLEWCRLCSLATAFCAGDTQCHSFVHVITPDCHRKWAGCYTVPELPDLGQRDSGEKWYGQERREKHYLGETVTRETRKTAYCALQPPRLRHGLLRRSECGEQYRWNFAVSWNMPRPPLFESVST